MSLGLLMYYVSSEFSMAAWVQRGGVIDWQQFECEEGDHKSDYMWKERV